MSRPRPAVPVRDPWHASPLGIAVTALGLAAIVGLVAWPRPTAYVLCATTGLLALVAGVLMLRGELTHRDEPAEEAEAGIVTGPSSTVFDDDDLCTSEYPDGEFEGYIGHLCNLTAGHDGDHRALAEVGPGWRRHLTWATAACAGCVGCGGPDCIQRPEPDACPTCGNRGA